MRGVVRARGLPVTKEGSFVVTLPVDQAKEALAKQESTATLQADALHGMAASASAPAQGQRYHVPAAVKPHVKRVTSSCTLSTFTQLHT